MVVFPTTLCLELGKETVHQVRASAKVRLQQLDLDAFGLDEPHRITIWIPVNIGIVKLPPAVKLLGVYDNKKFRRFPVHLQMPLNVSAVESKPASDGRIKTGHYFE
jgi:hypothetical protein